MTCGKCKAHEAGRLSGEEFAEHIRTCAECAELVVLDTRLDKELGALRETVPDSGLWDRIETALGREKAHAAAPDGLLRRPLAGRLYAALLASKPLLAAAGAAALLVLAIGAVLVLKKPIAPSGILARQALANVEIKEKEYADAIAALEKQAGPRIEAMDLRMASLYRDKLAAFNAQIEKCREALASNPGNAHIRSYLLAALYDKREALTDALERTN